MIEPVNAVQGSTESPSATPVVLSVTIGDLLEIMAAGLRDFRAAPLYGLTVAGIYTAGGWLLILLLVHFDLPYLIYPLAAGFALIAPFIAAAFYAVSRSLEQDEPLSWRHVLGSTRAAVRSDLGWMALVSGFSLFIWMDIAALLFFGFLGLSALSAPELLRVIFTTPMGLLFLLIGNGVGAVIAFAVFSFSVTFLSDAVRPKGRLRHRHGDQREGRCEEQDSDDSMVPHDSRSRLPFTAVRSHRAPHNPAGSRPCHVASLPPSRRAGAEPRVAAADFRRNRHDPGGKTRVFGAGRSSGLE